MTMFMILAAATSSYKSVMFLTLLFICLETEDEKPSMFRGALKFLILGKIWRA